MAVAKNIKSAMALCPKCSTPVTVDFGIHTCSVCESVLFIDFNGNVQLDSGQNADPMPAPNFNIPPANISSPTEGFLPPAFETTMPAADPLVPLPPPVFPQGNNEIPDMPAPLPEAPQQLSKAPTIGGASSDLSDVAAFGNSEASLGKDGAYIYDVLIWNIDSKEIREALREALKDKRFAWDAERIMSSINQGAVRIAQVNAVKAAVLINRIKNLPLGISWEQSLHTESVR